MSGLIIRWVFAAIVFNIIFDAIFSQIDASTIGWFGGATCMAILNMVSVEKR